MKWKTTIGLLIVTGAVFAYMWFVERKIPDTEEAGRRAGKVVNFDRDKIDGVVIENGDEKIELRRHDKKWTLESPIKDQADANTVDDLLSDVESWSKDETISGREIDADKNKLNEYDVNKPKLRLKLFGEGAPPEILFGKDTALEGKEYVRLENSKAVLIATQSVKKAIDKKPEDFRDKKLTDLIMAQVQRVVLKTSVGEMELQKQGDHWEIVKPLRSRADDQKVSDMIAQVTTARIQQFVADDKGDLRKYGLAEPHGSITLFAENDKQGQTLQVGGRPEKEKDQTYVRFSSRGFVYTLPKKIEELLNTRPNDLRDRHLVRIDTKNLDRLTIDATGKQKVVLARKNEDWTMVSKNSAPANSSEVRRLIDGLQNEQVTRFVEDVASNLPKYGLDKPQLQLTFSSFASENTAETKAGEQPFASVAFGKAENNEVYARVGDEPFVVAVQKPFVDGIFTDPIQWQDLAVFKFKPEQIHRITVAGGKEITVVRGPNNEWTTSDKSAGALNQTNIQSLLNTLSNLHAVRWIGATVPQQGLDKPQLTVTFTTSPDDKAVHKLRIGANAPNGTWFAKIDERDGTFTLPTAQFSTLTVPLVSPPAPSALPSTSAPPATFISPSAAPTP